MRYISTRGESSSKNFDDAVLTGLAPDGGLYVPQHVPRFSIEEIESWQAYSYQELAQCVMWPYVGDRVSSKDLELIIEKSYSGFRDTSIAPLVDLGLDGWILELFHGPTLAFKDFALQFLGNLLDHILEQRAQKVVILGATSGDTGSAAIEGCRGCNNIDMFILHPHDRISDVQRRQMTTVNAANVNNIALLGNFDDCQNLVKACFSDQSFLPADRQLVAVNSINWARIMAQIVYYFWASLRLGGPKRKVSFSVPTGNFGDVFAGYLAYKMGLPIERLIVATNQNDILHRCISANDHTLRPLTKTLTPSMDIMISSNFERLLFDVYDRDGETISRLMAEAKGGKMFLSEAALNKVRQIFSSFSSSDSGVIDMISSVYREHGYLLDPHTAIGLEAARYFRKKETTPVIALATAHPAKFPEALKKAGYQDSPPLPNHMTDLFERAERFSVLENNHADVEKHITERIQN